MLVHSFGGNDSFNEPAHGASNFSLAVSRAHRVTSEGVDLLLRQVPQASSISTRRVVKYLQEHSLFLLPADKEGGFAVMHHDMFGTKAISAIESVFQCHEDVSLSKAKKYARQLCQSYELKNLCTHIDRSKLLSLSVFFQCQNP